MKGILLTASPTQIVSYVIGAIIIAASILLVVKHLQTQKGKEELETFLKDIEDVVRNEILKKLASIDFKKIVDGTDSLLTAEAELIHNLYEAIWELVQRHLDEAYGDNSLYIIMKSNLTREFIQSFTEMIVNSKVVQDIISDKIANAADLGAGDELEKEYEEINKRIEDDTLAEGEVVPEVNLEQAMPDVEPIVPPSDNSPEFDSEVDEIVGEKEEEVTLDEVSKAITADDDE